MIQIVTVEREYGSGGAAISKALAQRLGWALWDEGITQEIARRLKCDPKSVEQREERLDTGFYRLMKVFMRGSYEDRFSGGGTEMLDAESLARLFEYVIKDVAGRGPCVIVGRAAPWFLRDYDNAMHTFLYAPYEEKMRRVLEMGKPESEAEDLLETIDRDRAAFIRHYYGKTWPQRELYHLMINTKIGNDAVVKLLLQEMELLNQESGTRTTLAAS